MARRKIDKRAAQAAPAPERASEPAPVGLIRRCVEEPRRLLTVDVGSTLWAGEMEVDPDAVKGAIVRLLPPADATDLRIEEVRALFEAAGAAAVRPMPRAAIGRVGEREVGGNAVDTRAVVDLRAAVLAVAARMAAADPAALKAELEAVMSEVGL